MCYSYHYWTSLRLIAQSSLLILSDHHWIVIFISLLDISIICTYLSKLNQKEKHIWLLFFLRQQDLNLDMFLEEINLAWNSCCLTKKIHQFSVNIFKYCSFFTYRGSLSGERRFPLGSGSNTCLCAAWSQACTWCRSPDWNKARSPTSGILGESRAPDKHHKLKIWVLPATCSSRGTAGGCLKWLF